MWKGKDDFISVKYKISTVVKNIPDNDRKAVLRNRKYFLRGSGFDFGRVTAQVPVPAPYLDHKRLFKRQNTFHQIYCKYE
jgi:hypothetical protein